MGQWGLRYCNDSMVLFVVTFRTLNSVGEGDYFDGIAPDCAAPDDWDHLLGDPRKPGWPPLSITSKAMAPSVRWLRRRSASLGGGGRFDDPAGRDGIYAGGTLVAQLLTVRKSAIAWLGAMRLACRVVSRSND